MAGLSLSGVEARFFFWEKGEGGGRGNWEDWDGRKGICRPKEADYLSRVAQPLEPFADGSMGIFFFFFCFLGESCRWWQPVGQSHCETNLEQFGVAGSTGPRGWSRFSPGSFSFSRSLFLEMGPPAKGLGTVLQAVNELMMDCSVVRLCKLASMS